MLQRLTDAQNALLGVAAGAIEAASTLAADLHEELHPAEGKGKPRPAHHVPRHAGVDARRRDADRGPILGLRFPAEAHREGKSPRFDVRGGGRVRVSGRFRERRALYGPGTDDDPAAAVRRALPGTLRRLYERNGLSGLFRGFVPASQREAFCRRVSRPVAARRRVCDSLEMSPTAGVAAGSIASGVLCAALTHPFDTCKSIIQGDLECGGLSATARSLYAENGIQGFFRGYPARAAMICCCFFIFNVCARRPRGLPHRRIVDTRRLPSRDVRSTARVRGSPLDGASMGVAESPRRGAERLTVSTPRRRRSCGSAWRSSPTGSSTSHGGTLNKFTQRVITRRLGFLLGLLLRLVVRDGGVDRVLGEHGAVEFHWR